MKKTLILILGVLIVAAAIWYLSIHNRSYNEWRVADFNIQCESPWDPKWAIPSDTDISHATSIYYISSSRGNDTNDGRTSSSAWKTIQKVNGIAFQPGDFVLLKRGDTWKEKLSPPTSGTAQAPITFGAYGGNGPRPILHKQESVVVISNKNFIVLNNLDIRDCEYCIKILGSDSIVLEYLNAGLNAGGAVIDIDQGSDRGIIQYNKIDGGTERPTERDMIRLMDGSNWNIHHNLIGNMGHDGINLLGRIPRWHDVEAYVTKNEMHHNEFFTNLDYGRAFSTQGNGPGYAAYNKIYENYVHDTHVSNQIQGDNNEIFKNIIINVRKTPGRADDEIFQSSGITVNDYIYSANNKIYDNFIANTDGPGIVVSSSENDNEFKNNVILNPGVYRGAMKSMYNIGIYIMGIAPNQEGLTGHQIYLDNNIFSPNSDRTIIYREFHDGSPTPISIAEFNAKNGQNADTIIGNIPAKGLLPSSCRITLKKPRSCGVNAKGFQSLFQAGGLCGVFPLPMAPDRKFHNWGSLPHH